MYYTLEQYFLLCWSFKSSHKRDCSKHALVYSGIQYASSFFSQLLLHITSILTECLVLTAHLKLRMSVLRWHRLQLLFGCRLLPCKPETQEKCHAPKTVWPGSCLVTGGLGSLGLLVALWLSELSHSANAHPAAAQRLVLLGRSGRLGGSFPALTALLAASGGMEITLARSDISSAEEAAAAVHNVQMARLQNSMFKSMFSTAHLPWYTLHVSMYCSCTLHMT